MPTKERQRQKRETKRQDRRAIKLHSSALAVGHSAPLPSPPDFGPAKFTAEQQAANPNLPMTRRVKDFLRVGAWKEGFDAAGNPVFGQYDEAELGIILNNAIAMMAAGDPINLGKSHGDDQMIIPTDELISPIDQVKLANGVLWLSTYVTPAQAAYLDNPAIKVSAGLFPDYVAGNGTKYKGRTLLHVAATDRPVVGGQGPFIALSNYVPVAEVVPAVPVVPTPVPSVPAKPAPAKSAVVKLQPSGLARFRKRVAEIKGRRSVRFNNALPRAIALASSIQGSGQMDIAALIVAINTLLKAMGLGALPEGTDETNLVPILQGISVAIGGDVPPEEPDPNADPNAPPVAPVPGAPAMMANWIRQVDQRITQANKPVLEALATLSTAVKAKAGEVVLDAKAKYILMRNALAKAGVTEFVLAAKDKIAERIDWDTEILEGLVPTIKMSNLISAAGATVEPPKEPETCSVLTQEQVEAKIKARGGKPENAPKA